MSWISNLKSLLVYKHWLLKSIIHHQNIKYYTSVILQHVYTTRIFQFPPQINLSSLSPIGIRFDRISVPIGVIGYREKIHAVYQNDILVCLYYTYGYQNHFEYYAINLENSHFDTIDIQGTIYYTMDDRYKVIVYDNATFTVNTIFN